MSDRERRLWLSLLVVMAAIYATLGPAQTLAQALRERNLLRVSMATVVIVGATIVIGRWIIETRPGRRDIGIAAGVIAVYLIAVARIFSPEERTHLIEYGVVALLIHGILTERIRAGHRIRVPAVLSVGTTALLGWVDEGIQAVLPNRVYDIRDVGFNALAGLMAITASIAFTRLRRLGAGEVRPR